MDLHVVMKRFGQSDTTIDTHTCAILFESRGNNCIVIIGDPNTYTLEDQVDPATLYAPFTTAEQSCP